MTTTLNIKERLNWMPPPFWYGFSEIKVEIFDTPREVGIVQNGITYLDARITVYPPEYGVLLELPEEVFERMKIDIIEHYLFLMPKSFRSFIFNPDGEIGLSIIR